MKESALAARDALRGRNARSLARELLAMMREGVSRACKGSPITRAKFRGVTRAGGVVLGNVATSEDVDVLTRALDDPEPLVREHAAWRLERIARKPVLDDGSPGVHHSR